MASYHLCVTQAWLKSPQVHSGCRQLVDSDFEAFAALIPANLDAPFTRADWEGVAAEGTLYFGCFEGTELLARAGVWKRAPDVWEVIAVRTREDHRREGLGSAVVYSAAAHILRNVSVASYTVDEENLASLRTAQAVGFRFCTHLVHGEKWCAMQQRERMLGARCPLLGSA